MRLKIDYIWMRMNKKTLRAIAYCCTLTNSVELLTALFTKPPAHGFPDSPGIIPELSHKPWMGTVSQERPVRRLHGFVNSAVNGATS